MCKLLAGVRKYEWSCMGQGVIVLVSAVCNPTSQRCTVSIFRESSVLGSVAATCMFYRIHARS
jgi:hypothetical protein